MTDSIKEDAHAVLLPAFKGTTLSDPVRRFLDRGGLSILLGESRAEYVARRTSAERRAVETGDTFRQVTSEAKARSDLLLACVDQEMGGICRLEGLVPPFPADPAAESPAAIEAITSRIAAAAAAMGVNVFLAPVVDVLVGRNDWLQGRTWSADPAQVGALSAAYVRGVQSAGVAATVKHFPGFGTTTGDPAIDPRAINSQHLAALEAGFRAFTPPIRAGAEMVMVGPAPVTAIDTDRPALGSPKVIRLLRESFGFDGVVMADDLDAKATLQGKTVPQLALQALDAGCDFLLLADAGDQLEQVAETISKAAYSGRISASALAASAQKLRDLARRYDVKKAPT